MTFSVTISVNGQTELICSAIRSVLNQKNCTSKAEVIVIDDARSDAVRKAVEAFGLSYVRYYETPDGDPAKSAQECYNRSTGDYVMWMCYDDFLLPYAFRVFEEALARTGAEVATGLHLYYYDSAYPKSMFRNTAHLIHTKHYDGSYEMLDLNAIRRTALRMPPNTGDPFWFHLHLVSTMFSRNLLERVQERTGGIVVPNLQNNDSQQVMIHALARSAVGIGLPLSIAGRLGISFTQEFYLPKRVAWRKRYQIRRSPVTGGTYINHILEAILSGKERVEKELAGIEYSHVVLLRAYVKDLVTVEFPLSEMRRLWREAENAARQLKGVDRKELLLLIKTERRLSYALHPFKTFGLWKHIRKFIVPNRSILATIRCSFRQLWSSNASYRRRNVIIPLEQYGVSNIEALAAKLPEIVLKETGKTLPR